MKTMTSMGIAPVAMITWLVTPAIRTTKQVNTYKGSLCKLN